MMKFAMSSWTERQRIAALTTALIISLLKQACAAEIAVRYAALTCKQNKRYHTSARLTKTRDRCSNVNKHGTDGQTDRRTDRQTDGQTECNAICGPLLRRRAA